MSAKVFSFLRPTAAPRDWSAQELGEFYRVESALIQTGLQAISARGLTDEGEPWFVFCRAEDDEVIIHFARIDGRYVISAPAYCGNAEGADFRALVRGIIERHPVLRPRPSGDNLFLHPTALLVVLVASALLKSSPAAEAAPIRATAAEVETKYRGIVPSATSVAFATATMTHDVPQETLILAALAARLTAPVHSEPLTMVVSASAGLPEFPEPPSARPVGASLLDESRDVAGADSLAPVAFPTQPVTSPAAKAMSSLLMNVPLTDALAHPLSRADDLVALSSLAEPVTQAVMLSEPPSHLSAVTLVASIVDPAASAQHVSLSTLTAIPKADIDLLRTLGVSDNVAYLNTVPAVFSTVLDSGMHKAAPPVAALSHADATAQTPAHLASASAASASAASTSVVAASETVPIAPASGAVVPHVGEATTAATGSALSDVLAAVRAFQAVETHPVVLITDHSAIFYDAGPITTSLPTVKSITFDLGDGFSVSLVGLPAELAHAGVHA